MFDSSNKFFFNPSHLSNSIYYIHYPIPKRRNEVRALKEGMKGNVQTTKIIRACKGGETRRRREQLKLATKIARERASEEREPPAAWLPGSFSEGAVFDLGKQFPTKSPPDIVNHSGFASFKRPLSSHFAKEVNCAQKL